MSESFEKTEKLCPQCGNAVDVDARFCKHCAFDLDASSHNQTAVRQQGASGTELISPKTFAIVCSVIIVVGFTALFFANRKLSQSAAESTTNPVAASSPSSSSKGGALTVESAQNALDRFANNNGSGQIRIRGGVKEIPAQNSATAELNVDDFYNKDGRRYSNKRGIAGFSRYTDGRWTLTEVVIMLNGFDRITWHPTIEVR